MTIIYSKKFFSQNQIINEKIANMKYLYIDLIIKINHIYNICILCFYYIK